MSEGRMRVNVYSDAEWKAIRATLPKKLKHGSEEDLREETSLAILKYLKQIVGAE